MCASRSKTSFCAAMRSIASSTDSRSSRTKASRACTAMLLLARATCLRHRLSVASGNVTVASPSAGAAAAAMPAAYNSLIAL